MDEIDPIEEIHEIRRKLVEKAGGTPEAYIRYLMEQQKLHPEGLVDLSKPAAGKSKPGRRTAKTTAKTPARKPGQRRRAVQSKPA